MKKYLVEYFNKHFFNKTKSAVIQEYKRFVKHTLGDESHPKHLEDLHDFGYLPLNIRSIPEGTVVPIRTPLLTIENTNPKFYWLTNYIESLASAELWQPCTSASISRAYRTMLNKYAMETGNTEFVQFQGHDFSFRGMANLEAAAASGAGHLLSFVGTDSIPAIHYLEEHYGANIEKELVGTSIPATEHSVMCSYGQNELETYRRLITEVYPSGFVSIVSDTWDFWTVLETVLPKLRNEIMTRNGRLVIRPDSGDPVKIICGDDFSSRHSESHGAMQKLWDVFGGTTNAKGYKELDTHIGLIYGDAITFERAQEISEKLKQNGFASTNVVYGIGSYTYQYNTRDTLGFALKSSFVKINGEPKQIFKSPKTDPGFKKSFKGRVAVIRNSTGQISVTDGLIDYHENDIMKTIFLNGNTPYTSTLNEIRLRLSQ